MYLCKYNVRESMRGTRESKYLEVGKCIREEGGRIVK